MSVTGRSVRRVDSPSSATSCVNPLFFLSAVPNGGTCGHRPLHHHLTGFTSFISHSKTDNRSEHREHGRRLLLTAGGYDTHTLRQRLPMYLSTTQTSIYYTAQHERLQVLSQPSWLACLRTRRPHSVHTNGHRPSASGVRVWRCVRHTENTKNTHENGLGAISATGVRCEKQRKRKEI